MKSIEILNALGFTIGQILLLIVIGFFGKKLFEYFFSESIEIKKAELNIELEKHKSILKLESEKFKLIHDKEIESYKSNLHLINSRQNLLHSNRSQVILELYQKLVVLHNSMLDMTARMRNVTGKDEETIDKEELERISKTASLGEDFFNFYQIHKIYFVSNICVLIEEIQTGLRDSHSDYSFRHLWGLPPSEMTYDIAKKANDKVKNEIPELMEKLEHEFRKSIGVIEE